MAQATNTTTTPRMRSPAKTISRKRWAARPSTIRPIAASSARFANGARKEMPCNSVPKMAHRSDLDSNRIARVIFCMGDGHMILLHGFIKKTQKAPQQDIDLALKRKREVT